MTIPLAPAVALEVLSEEPPAPPAPLFTTGGVLTVEGLVHVPPIPEPPIPPDVPPYPPPPAP